MARVGSLLIVGFLAISSPGVYGEVNAVPVTRSPSVPPIQCDLSFRTWCIVGINGTIRLEDDGHRRVLSLYDMVEMKDGPLVITERERNCADPTSVAVRKLFERAEGSSLEIAFALTPEKGCELLFKIPRRKDGSVDMSYRQVMDFKIMVNGSQLYKYENQESRH